MISVILLNYFSHVQVYQYVQHLKITVKNKLNFIIIDNSTNSNEWKELILEFIRNRTFSGEQELIIDQEQKIILFRNKENGGYAKGNNIGIEIAKKYFNSEFALVSNCDLRLANGIDFNGWKEELRINQNIAVIGPKVIGINGEKQSPCRKMTFWERWCINLLVYPFNRYIFRRQEEILDIDSKGYVYRLQGSFLFCSIPKMEKAGLFDEGTFLYAEELILAERLNGHGLYMLYDPSITIIHEHSQVIGNFYTNLQKDLLKLKSECYYYQNYLNYPKSIWPIGKGCLLLFYFKKRIVNYLKLKFHK